MQNPQTFTAALAAQTLTLVRRFATRLPKSKRVRELMDPRAAAGLEYSERAALKRVQQYKTDFPDLSEETIARVVLPNVGFWGEEWSNAISGVDALAKADELKASKEAASQSKA